MAKAWYDVKKEISTLVARVLKVKKGTLPERRIIMNPDIFTQKSLEAVRDAQRLAAEHQNQQIEQVHLLLALLRQDGGLIPQLLKKIDLEVSQ